MKYHFRRFLMLPLLSGIMVLVFNQCHVARYFYWNVANIDDYQKFDNDTIRNANPKPVFKYSEHALVLPEKYSGGEASSLDAFLKNTKSVSFAFIVNDTIWKESYYNDYQEESIVTSFSVAKSFVATLTGIAIDEGHIASVDDPVVKYLSYVDKDEFGDMTIQNLLDMRSGLKANEGYYNPFGDVAKYYYGTNLPKYLTQIRKKSPPDQYFEYLSVNTQLLADVVENATGKIIQQYLEEKIWRPLGMESEAYWSVDSKRNNKAKAFCCLSAQTLDFARFGRLYLNNGQWNGQQIIPENWIKETITYDSTNIDWQNYPYSNQFRVTRYGAFFAKGIKGQYIYIYPEKGLVAVRFGKSYADIDWADFFKHLAEKNILE
jgi:CubicO group peptidase (beta-lactamase class C family)